MATVSSLDLTRFLEAQDSLHGKGKSSNKTVFEKALKELKRGRQKGDYMPYVFPRVAGLDSDDMSREFVISSYNEAKAYYRDDELCFRLTDAVEAVLDSEEDPITIFGAEDANKFKACLTLFASLEKDLEDSNVFFFQQTVKTLFGGDMDQPTLDVLTAFSDHPQTRSEKKGSEGVAQASGDHAEKRVTVSGTAVPSSVRYYHLPQIHANSSDTSKFCSEATITKYDRDLKGKRDPEYELNGFIASRMFEDELQYQVTWRDAPLDLRWYPAGNFKNASTSLIAFHKDDPTQPGPPLRLGYWYAAYERGTVAADHRDDNKAASASISR